MLTDNEIFEKAKTGVSQKVTRARKMAEKVAMHLTGVGAKDYLILLDDYENMAQKSLREKLLKSNKCVLSYLLRPFDKIFTAKGGSVTINSDTETNKLVEEALRNVTGTYGIKKHLKKTLKDQFIIDPNTILFFDIDADKNPTEVLIPSSQQLSYGMKNNEIEWFIYLFDTVDVKHEVNGFERSERQNIYRYIDSQRDVTFAIGDASITKTDSEISRNGRLPGKFLGDEMHPVYNIHKSIIWDIVEELDEMLRDTSVQTVHKLAHNYPIYWWYANDCIRCNGEGQVIVEEGGINVNKTCPSCGGDGKHKRKNASDSIILSVPSNDDPVLAPNIAGVVQPSVEWIREMLKFEENAISKMYRALWGDVKTSSGKRETATGRIIDAQPSVDRLRDHSDTFSKIHKHYIDQIGAIVTSKKINSSVFYGTRYLLDISDELISKISEARRDGAPSNIIMDLVNRYYENEYQNDELELIKKKKIATIEPFPDVSVKDIIQTQNRFFIEQKLLYPKFVKTLKNEDLILKSEEELEIMFNQFIQNARANQI